MMLAVITVTSATATAFADTKAAGGLSLGADDGITLADSVLMPGEKYSFPLQITVDGKTEAFTKDHMEDHNLRLENLEGKDAITTAKLVESGKKYHLEMTTKGGWPTKQTEVSYRIRYINKTSGKVAESMEVSFAVGYETASDGYIDGLSKGDNIQVDADAPVFTKDQLEKLAELNDYKKVVFAADDWSFEASITGMSSINMLYNTKAVQDILEKFPNHDFKFLTFPAGPAFKGNAKLEMDVSDVVEDFDGKFYVYRYLNGKLTKEGFSYDQENETLSINTNQLGRFVISDKEIADGTVIFDGGSSSSSQGGNSSSSSTDGSSSSSSQGGSTGTSKPNPGTGVGNGFAMASIGLLAVASLFVVGKKK